MKENWRICNSSYKEIQEKYHLDPILAKVIANRTDTAGASDYIDREGPLRDPMTMKGMPEAIALIRDTIAKGRAITVIGDYDVDGMTSSTILYQALTKAGASVRVRIPDRVEDGYGMRPYMVEDCAERGDGLIITCDNGIREFEAADTARRLGIPLIITDHHSIAEEDGMEKLPDADVVVNPHQKTDPYGFENLCGAGVAYQTARALMQSFGMPEDPDWIGYAALGTVCDVMELIGENRKIVYQGLRRWNAHPPASIQALMRQGSCEKLDVYAFGFIIGPMINSGGRLDSQQNFISVMLSQDPVQAETAAKKLFELNRQRQLLTDEGMEQAAALCEKQKEQTVQVIYLPELHESLAGLVAGKIKEKYYRPTFVLTGTADAVKGSGRSIPAYNMFAEMNAVQDCFSRFGGHPMAAGLSMDESRIGELRDRLNANAHLTEEDLKPVVMIDMAMPLRYANAHTADVIAELEPFGTGNADPMFADKGLLLERVRWMGNRKKAANLFFSKDGEIYETVTFRIEALHECISESASEEVWERLYLDGTLEKPIPMDICYHVGWNVFRGRKHLQINVSHLRPSVVI